MNIKKCFNETNKLMGEELCAIAVDIAKWVGNGKFWRPVASIVYFFFALTCACITFGAATLIAGTLGYPNLAYFLLLPSFFAAILVGVWFAFFYFALVEDYEGYV